MGLGVFLFVSLNHLAAQDKKPTTVTITITEDDKVTTDTTFELKEGQDSEMMKKMISDITGEDIHMNMSKSMSHSKVAMIHTDDDVVWHAQKGGDFEYHFDDLGINLDSIKEAHGGQKVMVMKDEDGNFTIRELGEGEDHIMLHEGDLHGKHSNVMIFSGDGDCEEIIKSMDHNVMIMTEDGDEEGKTKVIVKTILMDGDKEGETTMDVWVSSDEDSEGEEDVEVYVIKKGDKDVKIVQKKVKVEIEQENGDTGGNEGQETEKKVKKKK